ncbi:MAG: mevalonate kinase family protein [Pontibacterium sp.]
MQARAPGKLILSGEHSVVYGAPALALAVDEHVNAAFSVNEDQTTTAQLAVSISGTPAPSLSLAQASMYLQKLNAAFDEYLAAKRSINDVCPSPEALVYYAALQLTSDWPIAGTISTQSTLPLGAGMGSSAAAIAAVIRLAEQVLGQTPLSANELLKRVAYCERLQHGRGSIIDASAVSYGGMVRVEQGVALPQTLLLPQGFFRIFSGKPTVSTGQCVDKVRQNFEHSQIWSEFTATTEFLVQGLQAKAQGAASVISAIKANHALLTTIGVVPNTVVRFIADLEALGGCAKISGAGATEGERGGMLVAFADEHDVKRLATTYGFSYAPLRMDEQGACALS